MQARERHCSAIDFHANTVPVQAREGGSTFAKRESPSLLIPELTDLQVLERIRLLSMEERGRSGRLGGDDLPLKSGDRVVIVGGGYAGSITALNLRKLNPQIQVKIIERRSDEACCHAGGVKTCKGCFGWVAATAVDKIAELGVEVPPDLILAEVDNVEFRNLAKRGAEGVLTPAPRPVIHRGLVIANGNGPAGLIQDRDISFTRFLREEAERKGVEVVSGTVRSIFVPEDGGNNAFVRVGTGCGQDTRDEVMPAELVVNATGVNDPNKLEVLRYGIDGESITAEKVGKPVKLHGAGVFELMLKPDEIEKIGLNPRSFMYWYGLKGTEAVLSIIKSAKDKKFGEEDDHSAGGSKRKHWMTIVVSPAEDILEKTIDKAQIRRRMTDIYYDFLEKSGISEVVGKRTPQCRCTPFVPVEVADYRTDNRYACVGDVIGNMKYKKNGIGVLADYSETLAQTAVDEGVSRKALENGTRNKALRTRYDNILGKMVFKGAVFMNSRPALAKLEERVLGASNAVRQFGSRLVIGNTEFETTYAGNMLTAAKELVTGGGSEPCVSTSYSAGLKA